MNNRDYKIIILIVLIGFLAYSNIYSNEFVWDDVVFVQKNVYIHDLEHIKEIFTLPLGAGSGRFTNYYRPLQQLAFASIIPFFGLHIPLLHALSVLFHVGCAILFYLIIKRITNNQTLAFISSSLWVVHPVHTESISFISGLAAPLMLFFGLLSFYLYILFREKHKISYLIASITAFVLALLSKEILITLPLVLILYETIYKKESWKENLHLIWYIVILILYFTLRNILHIGSFVNKNIVFNILPRIYTFLTNLAIYFKILIFPTNLHLDYDIQRTMSITPGVVIMIFVCLFLFYIAWINWKKRKEISFGILWFFITFIPMSGIVPGNDLFFEHWLYVPSIGAILAISYGLTKLKEQYPKIVPGALATIIIILIALTLQQNQVWQNQYTLYSNTLQYEEGTDRVHNNIALYYMTKKDFDQAKYHLDKALLYNNRNIHVHYNLGKIYYEEGNVSKAIQYFTNSVEINPRFSGGYRWLGKIYGETGNNNKLHAHFIRNY